MRTVVTHLVCLVGVALAGCSSNEPQLVHPIEESEEEAVLLSTLDVADPRAVDQLVEGFHQLENGAWRWTERKFSVVVKSPGSSGEAPTAVFRLTVPEVVTQRLGPVTLTAQANGASLGSATYDEPGDYVFLKELPAESSGQEMVRLDFELDKALPAGDPDYRELAVIAHSIGLK
jgi:hypothetical protein